MIHFGLLFVERIDDNIIKWLTIYAWNVIGVLNIIWVGWFAPKWFVTLLWCSVFVLVTAYVTYINLKYRFKVNRRT